MKIYGPISCKFLPPQSSPGEEIFYINVSHEIKEVLNEYLLETDGITTFTYYNFQCHCLIIHWHYSIHKWHNPTILAYPQFLLWGYASWCTYYQGLLVKPSCATNVQDDFYFIK
jgi:hypothetical protein